MNKHQMIKGAWYKIRHRSPGQKYDRKSIMQYLGEDQHALNRSQVVHLWNARPTAGTQSMLDQDIVSVQIVGKPDRPFVAARW